MYKIYSVVLVACHIDRSMNPENKTTLLHSDLSKFSGPAQTSTGSHRTGNLEKHLLWSSFANLRLGIQFEVFDPLLNTLTLSIDLLDKYIILPQNDICTKIHSFATGNSHSGILFLFSNDV